jgi:hypothetical protein
MMWMQKVFITKKSWSTSLPQSDNVVINKNDSNSWQGKSKKTKNYFHTKNQTYTLVDLPPSKKKHTTTWVYKVKMHVNDIITKLKACLVTSNFQQRIIDNFDEMFILMVKCKMFHTITTLGPSTISMFYFLNNKLNEFFLSSG